MNCVNLYLCIECPWKDAQEIIFTYCPGEKNLELSIRGGEEILLTLPIYMIKCFRNVFIDCFKKMHVWIFIAFEDTLFLKDTSWTYLNW